MSDYSPTSSSYQTPATSPSEALYNTENRLRFVSHGMRNTTTGEVAFLDRHNVQQLQLDMALSRAERATNRLETSLPATTGELDREIIELHRDMEAILRMRKEDLRRAQRRRNQTLLFFVLVILVGVLGSWVLQHRGKEIFELLDF
ncbi:hypothetical protein FDENT_8071 [Fusarium denticulatum]|uniref:Uncharacterized protein n=1 Tax=Fusarium denticulatum TaxID=48507 RepID=A0A8H5U069_9HYPO|nr:hypothetical protein FDENT_8071 [Fusarium denticulatum]